MPEDPPSGPGGKAGVPRCDSRVLSSGRVDSASGRNHPVPIAVPVTLTPNVAIICAAQLKKLDANSCNGLGLNNGSNSGPRTIVSGHVALSRTIRTHLSLISRIRSNITISISSSFIIGAPFNFSMSNARQDIRRCRANHNVRASTSNHGRRPARPAKSTRGISRIVRTSKRIASRSNVTLNVFTTSYLPILLTSPIANIVNTTRYKQHNLRHNVVRSAIRLVGLGKTSPAGVVTALNPHVYNSYCRINSRITSRFIGHFPLAGARAHFNNTNVSVTRTTVVSLTFTNIRRIISSVPHIRTTARCLRTSPRLTRLYHASNRKPTRLTRHVNGVGRDVYALRGPL